MEQEKKTVGQQVVEVQEKYGGTKTQTARETTNEMSKEYLMSLEKIINDHQNIKEPYFILEILRPDPFLEGVIKLTHVARRTRPKAEWGLALYKVDNAGGELIYEWGLPRAEEAYLMMQDPEGWDAKLIKDIRDHIQGILV